MKDYTWTMLGPTKFHVKENGKVVIPKNTCGVECAFHQSSRPLLDKHGNPTHKMQNAYRWNGKIYNA